MNYRLYMDMLVTLDKTPEESLFSRRSSVWWGMFNFCCCSVPVHLQYYWVVVLQVRFPHHFKIFMHFHAGVFLLLNSWVINSPFSQQAWHCGFTFISLYGLYPTDFLPAASYSLAVSSEVWAKVTQLGCIRAEPWILRTPTSELLEGGGKRLWSGWVTQYLKYFFLSVLS